MTTFAKRLPLVSMETLRGSLKVGESVGLNPEGKKPKGFLKVRACSVAVSTAILRSSGLSAER